MGTRIKSSPDHIFELFCEIGIPPNSNKSSWIIWKYPYTYKDEETLKSVPEFAYPIEFDENAVHHFSFVLTNVDSKWTFGFCRHAPSASSCLVLLSYLPWHEAFYRILNHIADLSNNDKSENSKEVKLFLESLHKTKIPDPGLELTVHYGDTSFTVVTPDSNKLPSIPENRNITEYFNAIDAFNMITVFARNGSVMMATEQYFLEHAGPRDQSFLLFVSNAVYCPVMLHERRILIISKKLSRLSACVQAANSLIYPMHWQHIFIPVLPKHLLDYLSAPMPFLIGVPAATFFRMKQSDMGDAVILHADENVVLSPYADTDALPSEVLQSLRHDLKRPHEMIGDCVARAFLKASVKLIGGYWNALKLKPGEKISFSPELFVQTRPAPMQPFLEKMLELQIFQQFIESRLKMLNSGQGVSDVFEFELTAQEDKASTRLRNQYRDWVSNMKKEGGAFFKSVKIKVKDTARKGYKDIRSRLHEMHHHHKIVEDDRGVGFRKRGSSVPSLFLNGFEVPNLNNDSSKLTINKSNTSGIKSKLSLPLSDAQERNSNSIESPMLSFEPIDMDLMDDLHDYFFSSCSLCSESASQRTSISEPQLSDHSGHNGYAIVENESLSKHLPFESNGASKDGPPPPLLPRPPSSKSLSYKQSGRSVSPKRSYSSQLLDQPLIELDGKTQSNSASSCDKLLSLGENNRNGSSILNERSPVTSNPFSNVFQNINRTAIVVPSIKPTNPFYQNVTSVPRPISKYELSSGPNVKNMVNMWQSSTVAPPSDGTVLDASKTMLKVPGVIPYRSQPLSRTVSTPPSTFCTIMNSANSPKILRTTQNPFLATQDKTNKNDQCTDRFLATPKKVSLSWENFQ